MCRLESVDQLGLVIGKHGVAVPLGKVGDLGQYGIGVLTVRRDTDAAKDRRLPEVLIFDFRDCDAELPTELLGEGTDDPALRFERVAGREVEYEPHDTDNHMHCHN